METLGVMVIFFSVVGAVGTLCGAAWVVASIMEKLDDLRTLQQQIKEVDALRGRLSGQHVELKDLRRRVEYAEMLIEKPLQNVDVNRTPREGKE